jgi:hypothetical protein
MQVKLLKDTDTDDAPEVSKHHNRSVTLATNLNFKDVTQETESSSGGAQKPLEYIADATMASRRAPNYMYKLKILVGFLQIAMRCLCGNVTSAYQSIHIYSFLLSHQHTCGRTHAIA